MSVPGPSSLPDNISFPGEEEVILALWTRLDAFRTSLAQSAGKPEFTFYDGPPFATGLPHYGHILAGTIKDVVTRYATQTGHYVSRRFGWDCHGLPVEYEIDKALNIKGRDDVMRMGIDKYNAACRAIVTRYCTEWETTVTRLGRWIDFKNDYRTMEPWYMESVWWVFKTIFEKGLVYKVRFQGTANDARPGFNSMRQTRGQPSSMRSPLTRENSPSLSLHTSRVVLSSDALFDRVQHATFELRGWPKLQG